jgi:hypothetical protein
VEAWREEVRIDNVKIEVVDKESVDPVKGVGTAPPFIEETVRACVETAIEYVMPET